MILEKNGGHFYISNTDKIEERNEFMLTQGIRAQVNKGSKPHIDQDSKELSKRSNFGIDTVLYLHKY